MKKTIISFLSALLLTMYATVAYATHHRANHSEPANKRKLLSVQNGESLNAYHMAFFNFSVGFEFDVWDDLRYESMLSNIQYGRYFGKKSFFSAGVRLHSYEPALIFRYGLDFIRSSSVIPGLDISILMGQTWSNPTKSSNNEASTNNSSSDTLGFGFELGLYVKTFITKVHALQLRTGVVHENNQSISDFNFKDSITYIQLMLQWHF